MAETSNSRLTRLLTLVPWLTAHSGVSKAAAAAHFGLTVKQLEADLELITFTGPGIYGGELVDLYFEDETITVYDSQGFDRPLELTADEASTLLLGLRALQQLPDADQGAIASAMSKLTSAYSTPNELAIEITTPQAGNLIAEAINTGRDLELTYVHPLRDDHTERTITPLRLFSADGADYVEAWCHLAEAHRTFRLDRIVECRLGGPRSPVPAPAGNAAPVSRAVVAVEPRVEHVLEQVDAHITAGSNPIRAEIGYADERWLVQWAVAAGAGVRVVQPAHAQDLVRARAESALLAYGELGRTVG